MGYVSILSHHYLPGLLRAATEEMSGLRIHLYQDSPAALAEMVRSGMLDLEFLRDSFPLSDELQYHDFAFERIAVTLPDNHPLAKSSEVALSEMHSEGFSLQLCRLRAVRQPPAIAPPGDHSGCRPSPGCRCGCGSPSSSGPDHSPHLRVSGPATYV
ncbi:LysR substrate-binding domain-containing protein [Streptomyces sp. NPDC057575]|uniref:LysR substrate-binding domain-containing protein n=1 Tax=unclassified Streptomyces TaxID=2593676 RepID=UPI00367E07F9